MEDKKNILLQYVRILQEDNDDIAEACVKEVLRQKMLEAVSNLKPEDFIHTYEDNGTRVYKIFLRF